METEFQRLKPCLDKYYRLSHRTRQPIVSPFHHYQAQIIEANLRRIDSEIFRDEYEEKVEVLR